MYQTDYCYVTNFIIRRNKFLTHNSFNGTYVAPCPFISSFILFHRGLKTSRSFHRRAQYPDIELSVWNSN